MWISWEGCAHYGNLPEGARIDMNRCPGYIPRCQFPPDLHNMPPGFRPCQRQAPGQNARSGGAPNLVWFKAGCQCGCGDCLNAARDVRAESARKGEPAWERI
jgi:hypothetical protein